MTIQQLASIDYLDDKREFGLVATRRILKESVIVQESPIVCDQFLFNRQFFKACSHCLKSLEHPFDMLKRLAGMDKDEQISLPLPVYYSSPTGNINLLPCSHGCGDVYCSQDCASQAWKSYHSLCCKSIHPKVHELEESWKSIHFPPESATIGLLLRMIAMLITSSHENQYELFELFCCEDPEITANSQSAPFKNHDYSSILAHRFFSQGQHREQLDAIRNDMRSIFKPYLNQPRIDALFDKDAFDRLFCLMAVNGQGIGTSALEDYTRRLMEISTSDTVKDEDVTPEMCDEALDTLDELGDVIEEVSGEFTHVEGTGLYKFHSKINHSCRPNAEIRFPFNNATLQVVALCDIKEGDEICISYIENYDAGMDVENEYEEGDDMDNEDQDYYEGELEQSEEQGSFEKRRQLLRQFYLFDCECEKCLQQMAEIDEDQVGK